MIPQDPDRTKIEYPRRWRFQLIGPDEAAVRRAVAACLDAWRDADRDPDGHDLDFTRTSAGGKYVSLRLEVEVPDEAARDALFRALTGHPDIKMVL